MEPWASRRVSLTVRGNSHDSRADTQQLMFAQTERQVILMERLLSVIALILGRCQFSFLWVVREWQEFPFNCMDLTWPQQHAEVAHLDCPYSEHFQIKELTYWCLWHVVSRLLGDFIPFKLMSELLNCFPEKIKF